MNIYWGRNSRMQGSQTLSILCLINMHESWFHYYKLVNLKPNTRDLTDTKYTTYCVYQRETPSRVSHRDHVLCFIYLSVTHTRVHFVSILAHVTQVQSISRPTQCCHSVQNQLSVVVKSSHRQHFWLILRHSHQASINLKISN